jgi:hypothetical protein
MPGKDLLKTDSTCTVAECSCGKMYDAAKLESHAIRLSQRHVVTKLVDAYRTPCCGEFPAHWVRQPGGMA